MVLSHIISDSVPLHRGGVDWPRSLTDCWLLILNFKHKLAGAMMACFSRVQQTNWSCNRWGDNVMGVKISVPKFMVVRGNGS